ncbi:MAG: diacylglycerol kinase family lipid kinase [Bacteroidota bacterium]|nr:diacylglycerol kinase family lipid kinase [Bacteroidota bacterium]
MPKKKIIFIINPLSGRGKGQKVSDRVNNYIFENSEVESYLTDSIEEFHNVIQIAINEKPKAIIAVGGDGTVNAIASQLVNTDIAVGIVPIGSGNGLARDLKIPLNINKALYKIDHPQFKTIDAGTANGKYFFCAAGIGFDAHISKLFAKSKRRGFASYLWLSMQEFFTDKPQDYDIYIDGKLYKRTAFLIAIANASQYGNNAYIAPSADMNDGVLDVTVLKPIKLYETPILAWRLFTKKIYNSAKVESFKAREIIIKRTDSGVIHYDGESMITGNEIKYTIIENALTVLV